MNRDNPGLSLEDRIAQHITDDGSVIISPRMARWLEKQSGMTADRRIRLRHSDPDAYVALAALHLAAIGSAYGTNQSAAQPHTAESNTWMSTGEAADALGVTTRCIRKRCETGTLPAIRSGGRWLINRTTLALKHTAA